MEKINYFEIIKKSWTNTWSNKYLWWFGLLASFAGGGGLNYSFDQSNKMNGAGEKIYAFASAHLALVIGTLSVLFIVFIILSIIGIIGRAALIKAAEKSLRNEIMPFKAGFSEGKKYFWRLVAIGFSLSLFIIAAVFILGLPIIFLFASGSIVIGAVLSLLAIIILIPLIVLVVFLKNYGYLYAVLGELAFWPAIENAYALFRKNLGSSFVMILIFIPINIIFGIVMLLALIPVVLVLLFIGFILYLILSNIGIAITVTLGILIVITAILFLRSVYETFAQTTWIIFFQEIARPEIPEVVSEKAIELEAAPTPDPVKSIELE